MDNDNSYYEWEGIDLNDKDNSPSSYYALLGLPVNASANQIRRAFLELSTHYHTDKHTDASPEAQEAMRERFEQLVSAYAVLSNPVERATYDLQGPKGSELLALIPKKDQQSSQDIIDMVRFLERGMKLRKLAKMLSAESSIDISYNLAPLWSLKEVLLQDTKRDPENPPEPVNHEEFNLNVENPTLQQVTISGEKYLVIVPDQRTIQQLVTHRKEQLTTSQSANKKFFDAVMVLHACILPSSIDIKHSFVHSVSESTFLKMKATASPDDGPGASVMLHHQSPNALRSWSYSLSVALKKISLSTIRKVQLSPLWSLQTYLSIFDGLSILSIYNLELIRKFSESSELRNGLQMAMFRGTKWCTQFSAPFYAFSVLLGANVFSFSLAKSVEVSLDPTDFISSAEKKGEGKTPARRLHWSLGCHPFRGITAMGWSLEFYRSSFHSFHIEFSVSLPYTVSPVAPPYFVVHSNDMSFTTNSIRLTYRRGKHSISVPVAIFNSDYMYKSFLWLLVPLTALRLLSLCYVPFAKSYVSQVYACQRAEHIPEMDVARQRAILEQQAISGVVDSLRASEEEKSGLVIVSAVYGVLHQEYVPSHEEHPGSPTINSFVERPPLLTRAMGALGLWLFRRWYHKVMKVNEGTQGNAVKSFSDINEDDMLHNIPLTLDVTIALQNLVRESALTLPASTKSDLPGFYDTDPYTAEKKMLKIIYFFRGKRHVMVANDEDEVLLPQRDHLEE